MTRRRPSRLRLVLSLATAVAWLVATPSAQSDTSDAPTAAAQLVLRSNDTGADMTTALRNGLIHADPAVRFVAARLASVLRVRGLDDDLTRALATETNAQVAAEDVRALLFLDTPAATTTVQQYIRHAQVPAALAYAWWLARVHPDRMPDELASLVGAMHHQAYWLVDPMNTAVVHAPALTATPTGADGPFAIQRVGSGFSVGRTSRAVRRPIREGPRSTNFWLPASNFQLDERQPLSARRPRRRGRGTSSGGTRPG